MSENPVMHSTRQRSHRWYERWNILDPPHVASLLQLIRSVEHNEISPEAVRRVGNVLMEEQACLELPIGEVTTPGLEIWIWRWKDRLSDLYPPDDSRGRFNAQGLEYLIRIENEPLLSILLATQHIDEWRFAISLRGSYEALQRKLSTR